MLSKSDVQDNSALLSGPGSTTMFQEQLEAQDMNKDFSLMIPPSKDQIFNMPFGSETKVPQFVTNFFTVNRVNEADSMPDGFIKALSSQLADSFIQRYDHFKFIMQKEQCLSTTEEGGLHTTKKSIKQEIDARIRANMYFEDSQLQNAQSYGTKPVQHHSYDQFMQSIISTIHHSVQHILKSETYKKLLEEKVKPEQKPKDLTPEEAPQKFSCENRNPNCNDLKTYAIESVHKSYKKLLKEMTEEKAKLEDQIQKERKQSMELRTDFLKQVTVLQSQLGAKIDGQDADRVKAIMSNTLKVHFFEDTKNIDPTVLNYLNEKISILTQECEFEIAKINLKLKTAESKLRKFEQLRPEQYGLLELSLRDIFEGVSVIESSAYPVFTALMDAYPPNHFQTVIQEAGLGAQGAIDPNIVKNLLECADERERQSEELLEKQVANIQGKLKVSEENSKQSKQKMLNERIRNDEELLKLRQDLDTQNKQFIEQESIILQDIANKDAEGLKEKLAKKKEKLESIQQMKNEMQLKMMVFKWQVTAMAIRNIETCSKENFKTETQCLLLRQAFTKILQGPEFLKLLNQLKAKEERLKETNERRQNEQRTNFSLRLQINKLLTERNFLLRRTDELQEDVQLYHDRIENLESDNLEVHKHYTRSQEQIKNMTNLVEESIRVRELLEEKYGLKKREAPKMPTTITSSIEYSEETANEKKELKPMSALMEEALTKVKLQFTTRQIIGCYDQAQVVDKTKSKRSKKFVENSTQTGIKAINEDQVELEVKYLNAPSRVQPEYPCGHEMTTQTDIAQPMIDHMQKGAFSFELLAQEGFRDFKQTKEIFKDMKYDDKIKTLGLEKQKKSLDDERRLMKKRREQQQKNTDLEEDWEEYEPERLYLKKWMQIQDDEYLMQYDLENIKKYLGVASIGIVQARKSSINSQSDSQKNTLLAGDNKFNEVDRMFNRNSNISPQQMISADVHVSSNNADALSTLFGDKDKTVNLTISDGQHPTEGGPPTKVITSARSNAGAATSGRPSEPGQSNYQQSSNAANPFKNDHIQKLKEKVNKKAAYESFQMYIDLLDVFKIVQPDFFRCCIKILKEKKYQDFQLISKSEIQKLYPDFVPDVFLRLWTQDQNPEQEKKRQEILFAVSQEWKDRLISQGLLVAQRDIQKNEEDQLRQEANQSAQESLLRHGAPLMRHESPKKLEQSTQLKSPQEITQLDDEEVLYQTGQLPLPIISKKRLAQRISPSPDRQVSPKNQTRETSPQQTKISHPQLFQKKQRPQTSKNPSLRFQSNETECSQMFVIPGNELNISRGPPSVLQRNLYKDMAILNRMRNVSSHASYSGPNNMKLGQTILSGSQIMRGDNNTPTDNSTKFSNQFGLTKTGATLSRTQQAQSQSSIKHRNLKSRNSAANVPNTQQLATVSSGAGIIKRNMRPTTAKVMRGFSMHNSRKNMSAMRIEPNAIKPSRNAINPLTLNEMSEQFRYSRLSTHEDPIAHGLMTKQHPANPPLDSNQLYALNLNSPSVCDEVEEENIHTAKKKNFVRKSSHSSSRPTNPSGKNLRKMHMRNSNILGNKSVNSKADQNQLMQRNRQRVLFFESGEQKKYTSTGIKKIAPPEGQKFIKKSFTNNAPSITHGEQHLYEEDPTITARASYNSEQIHEENKISGMDRNESAQAYY